MREPKKIPVEVEFTEGYQERFTAAVLKIYAKRVREQEIEDVKENQNREIYRGLSQCQQVRVS